MPPPDGWPTHQRLLCRHWARHGSLAEPTTSDAVMVTGTSPVAERGRLLAESRIQLSRVLPAGLCLVRSVMSAGGGAVRMEARDIADWPYPAEKARASAAAQGRMSG
jgi:hypothetical protein